MYFSYKRDMTRSLQSCQGRPGESRGGGGDRGFVFNRELCRPLLEAGAISYALPLIVGYVGQVQNLVFNPVIGSASGAEHETKSSLNTPKTLPPEEEEEEEDGMTPLIATGSESSASSVPGGITLIARMDVGRAGTLMWRRGLDAAGNNAHTFEIEQEVSLQGPDGNQIHLSYVQLRASVPLIWSQKPWVMPRGGSGGIEVNTDMDVQRTAFESFVKSLLGSYQAVTLVNVPSWPGVGEKERLMRLMLRSLTLEHIKPGNPRPLSLIILGEHGLEEDEGGEGDLDPCYLSGSFLRGDSKSRDHFLRRLEPSILKHSYFSSSGNNASMNKKEQTGVLHTRWVTYH